VLSRAAAPAPPPVPAVAGEKRRRVATSRWHMAGAGAIDEFDSAVRVALKWRGATA
jgi:hypothetical protein